MKIRHPARWLGLIAGLLALRFAGWFIPNIPTPRSWEHWPAADSGWEAWQPLYVGVDYARANFSKPRPLKAHALRVDLSAPGVEIFANPPSEPGSGTCAAIYAGEFLKHHHLQLALNGGPFRPKARWPGVPLDPVGLMISDGLRWSDPVANLHALVITRDHRARVTQDQSDTADASQAIGGHLITLRGGTNTMEILDLQSVSVAGTSADGRILYWLIVDGRQPGWSEGLRPDESAAMIQQLGAADAIRMDEGSVVTLVKAGGWTGAEVVNRPSHPYVIGMQRPLGSLVGIRAQPLAK